MKQQPDKALLLFSGGKDSFLSACHLIANGYQVTLLSLNNGCLIGEEVFDNSAKRLAAKYGNELIKTAKLQSITGITTPFLRNLSSIPYKEMAKEYPNLTHNQAQCLCCQSAMWIAAIAYAKAKDIPNIAAGYKPSDLFCTGCQGYIDRLWNLTQENGIKRLLPVWNQSWAATSDTEARNAEMKLFGFIPKVQEAHCILGHHITVRTPAEENDMMLYFDKCIRPAMQDMIDHIVPIFRTTGPLKRPLSDADFNEAYTGLY